MRVALERELCAKRNVLWRRFLGGEDRRRKCLSTCSAASHGSRRLEGALARAPRDARDRSEMRGMLEHRTRVAALGSFKELCGFEGCVAEEFFTLRSIANGT